MFDTSYTIKNYIQTRALELGFSFVGFARAEAMPLQIQPLRDWIDAGMHAQMHYMANHSAIRTDPSLLVTGAQTVVSLAFNYYPAQQQVDDSFKIAKYAYGKDYHEVLKSKLHILLDEITEKTACSGRVFTDSAPILEREWARRAGLGWIGKNSLLITPTSGSYFFLAEIILDLAIDPDLAFDKNLCGSCTRCMDACPTQAIVSTGVVDARKCISYLTIEHRGEFDTPPALSGRIFGCDICQDVCPWNRKSVSHSEPEFAPHPDMLEMDKDDWQALTEDEYRRIFQKSAVKRTKFEGLRRNIDRANETESKE